METGREVRYTASCGFKIRQRDRQVVEEAARRRGEYLSEFIRNAALEEARRVLAGSEG